MIKEKIKIEIPLGLHLRPTGVLCTKALNYKCTIGFIKGKATANAKSVLSVLAACVRYGEEIELFCDGEDEQEAFEYISNLIKNGLGEKIS